MTYAGPSGTCSEGALINSCTSGSSVPKPLPDGSARQMRNRLVTTDTETEKWEPWRQLRVHAGGPSGADSTFCPSRKCVHPLGDDSGQRTLPGSAEPSPGLGSISSGTLLSLTSPKCPERCPRQVNTFPSQIFLQGLLPAVCPPRKHGDKNKKILVA